MKVLVGILSLERIRITRLKKGKWLWCRMHYRIICKPKEEKLLKQFKLSISFTPCSLNPWAKRCVGVEWGSVWLLRSPLLKSERNWRTNQVKDVSHVLVLCLSGDLLHGFDFWPLLPLCSPISFASTSHPSLYPCHVLSYTHPLSALPIFCMSLSYP